jgi:hypothetical protein
MRPAQGANDDSGALEAAPAPGLDGAGELERPGNSAATEADAAKLLQQLLALRMAELLGVPVQSDADVPPALSHGEAIAALTELLELDLESLVHLRLLEPFPFEEPVEVPVDFRPRQEVSASMHLPIEAPMAMNVPAALRSTLRPGGEESSDEEMAEPIGFPIDLVSVASILPWVQSVTLANPTNSVSPVSDANGAADSVTENAMSSTAVGITALATDRESGPVTYSLSDDANGRFAIDSHTGVVTVANGAQLDHEADTSHTITVVATSSSSTSERTFTIAVVNADEGPGALSDADGTANSVIENAAIGTVVGVAALATDPDGESVTYSLADDASGRFVIDSHTGVVTVANGAQLDHEAGTSHIITLVATSPGGTNTRTFTIDVVNADEAPGALSDVDHGANSVSDNAAGGTAVGITASAVDPEGDPVIYSLSDDAGGRFAIEPDTGAVRVANGTLLVPGTSYAITVVATSSGGMASQSYSITVTDLPDALEALDDNASTDQDTAVSGNVLTNDAGGTEPRIVSLASGPSSGSLSLNADGSFTYIPDANFSGSDSFTYIVTDGLGASDTATVTIAVAGLGIDIFGANDGDWISGTAARENIYGLSGSDVIFAGGGNDYVDGGNDGDAIFGQDGDDWLDGGDGTDLIFGGNGNDILSGGDDGSALLWGEAGDDTLIWSRHIAAHGGSGTDTLRVTSGDVDLTSGHVMLSSFEVVDLSRDSHANVLTISASDILDMSSTNVLTVHGTDADSVECGSGWTDGGIAGGAHIYTKNIGGSVSTLVIDLDVKVNGDILA